MYFQNIKCAMYKTAVHFDGTDKLIAISFEAYLVSNRTSFFPVFVLPCTPRREMSIFVFVSDKAPLRIYAAAYSLFQQKH